MWNAFWRWYFEPKPFEKAADGKIYRILGIRIFKRYLPTSGDLVSRRRGVSRLKRSDGGVVQALRRYERTTRSYEARHIFGALSMLAISWWAIAIHGKGNWPALLAANALINGYPIMLQRYNRVRLQTALRRVETLRSAHRASSRTSAIRSPASRPGIHGNDPSRSSGTNSPFPRAEDGGMGGGSSRKS